MVIVSNPEHPLYQSRGKIQSNGLSLDKMATEVPVLINDDLLFFDPKDLKESGSSKTLRTPNSRKEFYTFIQDSRTKKNDIIEVITLMTNAPSTLPDMEDRNQIEFKKFENKQDQQYSLQALISFIQEKTTDKNDIIQEIRSKRTAELMSFNLPNNNITAGQQQNKGNTKKYSHKKKFYKRKKKT